MNEMIMPALLDRMPIIYNIQQYSLQDGPGSRTTIFVKGCTLCCPWCHNPETQKLEKELLYDADKCTGCGKCIEVCDENGIQAVEGVLLTDRKKCVLCGKCIGICVAGAREFSGKETTIDQVVSDVMRDEMFFLSSGGGVTISGGDPMLFPDFTEEVARRLHENMIHVCVDTAACGEYKYLENLMPYTDLFLIDLKSMDEKKYREVIGGSLSLVQENIEKLLDAGAEVRVRVPVIPGFNDSDEETDLFTEYLGGLLKRGLSGLDLLPFHSYASKKYRASDRWDMYQYKEAESLQAEDLKGFAMKLTKVGFSGKNSMLTIGGLIGND